MWCAGASSGRCGARRVRAAGRRVLSGKTRCAAEAIRTLLPDWQLVHPDGPGQVAALAQTPVPRTVVWLDELQRYLDGEHGLAGGTVRALLAAPAPIVIIGTLWPDRYTVYTAVPATGGPDPRAREREVLGLADVVRVAPEFSPAEQDRACTAAGRDPQLRAALESTGYGLTQTLAAAPQLVARWQDAQAGHPYGWAVLTAALDAARLGADAPLTLDLLRAAAPGYCTSTQQAEAPASWFEEALAYAPRNCTGRPPRLAPLRLAWPKSRYTAVDYLIQWRAGKAGPWGGSRAAAPVRPKPGRIDRRCMSAPALVAAEGREPPGICRLSGISGHYL